MSDVVIEDITAMEAIEFKNQLSQSGLINEQDYVWRYHPVKYNHDWSTSPLERSRVVFSFRNPALASFYKLKWTK